MPFRWDAKHGNTQMVAGGRDDPIWFTNIISDGVLCTLTYPWPGSERRPCSRVGPYTLAEFNHGLTGASYVGPEILLQPERRPVNHLRAALVHVPAPEAVPPLGGGVEVRIPLMSGDFSVDRKDSKTFWQVLHFGLHHLDAEDLDAWMVMDTWRRRPGKVTVPDECLAQPDPATTTTVPPA